MMPNCSQQASRVEGDTVFTPEHETVFRYEFHQQLKHTLCTDLRHADNTCLSFPRHVVKGRDVPEASEGPHPERHLHTAQAPAAPPMDCTSESLPDPADEVLSQGQLPQTLVPSLIDVLEHPLGGDKLLADLV